MRKIFEGDCLDVLSGSASNFFDTLITDPPYGLNFMGKDWDHGIPGVKFWKEFLRVCKPGAFALVFGGTRTFHRLVCAIEDAGWQIRDCLMWLYGSGFPKSLNIALTFESQLCEYREVNKEGKEKKWFYKNTNEEMRKEPEFKHPLANKYFGYGTSFKPSWEPILVAMKPLDGTFAQNAEKYGVAGLWIDGGRIGTETRFNQGAGNKTGGNSLNMSKFGMPEFEGKECEGRWPANLILDEEAAAILDEQTGDLGISRGGNATNIGGFVTAYADEKKRGKSCGFGDSGGASRFFYCAKASKRERGDGNNHPTVKPLSLMEYLCRLTKTPNGGIVLDPFGGSGTTALACIKTGRDYVLIEKEKQYCEIIERRINGLSK